MSYKKLSLFFLFSAVVFLICSSVDCLAAGIAVTSQTVTPAIKIVYGPPPSNAEPIVKIPADETDDDREKSIVLAPPEPSHETTGVVAFQDR